MLDNYAPDDSMKMGEGLAYESVELRRRRRLPLKKRLSLLPNLGLIGGPIFLVLLIIMFLLVSFRESRGIYIRLTPQRGRRPDENCLAGPIVVTINQHGSLSRLLLNGTEVSREEFERALKSKLAERADWEVFIDGDDSVSFADPLYAIDIVNDLHAKAVILTPKLKQQIAEKGCPPR
ncbi:MAG: biopolymer transporter ExbD [Candidatus Sulfotelmatobacter sp.]|jgi:biopolymer transport protein ExbD